MQRCLLHGHNWVKMKGAGAYADREFIICSECATPLATEAVLRETVTVEPPIYNESDETPT